MTSNGTRCSLRQSLTAANGGDRKRWKKRSGFKSPPAWGARRRPRSDDVGATCVRAPDAGGGHLFVSEPSLPGREFPAIRTGSSSRLRLRRRAVGNSGRNSIAGAAVPSGLHLCCFRAAVWRAGRISRRRQNRPGLVVARRGGGGVPDG